MSQRLVARSPFSYSIDVPELDAGQSWTGHFTVQSDSNFLVVQRVYHAGADSVAYDDKAVSPVTVQLRDAGSGRMFMVGPMPVSCIFGSGEFPYRVPLGGKILYKRQVVEVLVSNPTSERQKSITLIFQGEKLFTEGN